MLISIIIPTYNSESLIGQVIKSVLEQTYKMFEIIIVDNMSNDKTISIINSMHSNKIKIYTINNHGIIAKSRNYGISMSNGELIAFLDSDDIWYKDRLMCVVDAVIANEEQHIFSTNEAVSKNLKKIEKIYSYGPYVNNFYEEMLRSGNRLSTSATVIRKSFLLENKILFREDKIFNTAEDYDLWLRLANKGAKFYFLNKVLGEYNQNENSTSKKIDYHFKSIENVLIDHATNIQSFDNNKNKMVKMLKNRVALQKLKALIKANNKTKSFILFLKCITQNPLCTIKNLHIYFFSK